MSGVCVFWASRLSFDLLPVLSVALLSRLLGVVGRVRVLSALLLTVRGLLLLLLGLLSDLLRGVRGPSTGSSVGTVGRLLPVRRPLLLLLGASGLAGRRRAGRLVRRSGLLLLGRTVRLERLLGRAARSRTGDGRLLGGGRSAEERVDASRRSGRACSVGRLSGRSEGRGAVGLVVAGRGEVAVRGRRLLGLDDARRLDVGRRERGCGRRGWSRGRLGVRRSAPLLLLGPSGVLGVVVG